MVKLYWTQSGLLGLFCSDKLQLILSYFISLQKHCRPTILEGKLKSEYFILGWQIIW